jgi:thiamine biosynthesis lipoprotein
MTKTKVIFLILLIVGTVYVIRQQRNMPYQHNEGMIFGTFYHVTYQCERDLKPSIEDVLRLVDNEYSMFNKESTVSKFNHDQSVSFSPMFLRVFRQAREISTETDGAFDVTVAPLVNAWGFGFKQQQMPTAAQVDSLLQLVGMKKLRYNEQKGTIEKTQPGMMLDFSAIAKGFGADQVARLLRQEGVQNFMVEIGGEVVARGISPNRVPWRIGVTKPTDDSIPDQGELQTVLNVTDMAMATSGNYRNFYYKGGRKYAHTIDPRSGYPVQHSLLSATVLASDCATADAYATSFMVLGIDGAKTVLERHPELMAYFIYTDAQGQLATWHTSSLEDKIED